MKTLEDFTKKQSPKRRKSKLNEYGKEIKELYDLGYRVTQIREFLGENGIDITERAIFYFLSKKDVNNNRNKTNKIVAGGSKNETKTKETIKDFNDPIFDVMKQRMAKVKELKNQNKDKK